MSPWPFSLNLGSPLSQCLLRLTDVSGGCAVRRRRPSFSFPLADGSLQHTTEALISLPQAGLLTAAPPTSCAQPSQHCLVRFRFGQ